MKVCVISDTHQRHRELSIPPCDLLIHCGDFCQYQKDEQETLEDVDDWFASLLTGHIVCIGGNHDACLQRKQYRFSHAIFLEDSRVEIGGFHIYGSPWCPQLSSFAYYASSEDLAERWQSIPVATDILLTHTPPAGILDQSSAKGPHLGCAILRQELDRVRPRLHVFGHIHGGYGTMTVEEVKSINAAMLQERSPRMNEPVMVEL